MVEYLASAREPASMAAVRSLLTTGDDRRVPWSRAWMSSTSACRGPAATTLTRTPCSRAGAFAPVVQLQQSDATADHYWPFTPEANPAGRVRANRVLRVLEASGRPRWR